MENNCGRANPFEKYSVIVVKRSQIRLAKYNPRTITTEAKKELKENIKRVGMLDPIIWNSTTGNVVSGHQRLSVMDSLNKSKDDYELTVSQVELDEKSEIEQNIFMNNPLAQGEYDQLKLPDLLKGINAKLAGFSAASIHKAWGEDALSEDPQALKEMSEKIDSFSEKMNAVKERTSERDNDTDFYLCLVFRNYDERKLFTDKYQMEDNLFVDPHFLEDQIKSID